MHDMSAIQLVYGLSRSIEIVHAYYTIVFKDSFDALMLSFYEFRDTAFTCKAMIIVLAAAISTNAAMDTMEIFLFLMIIIKNIANFAKILSKLNFTFFAILLRFLLMITIITFNQSYDTFIHSMKLIQISWSIINSIIMTCTTRIKLFAFWTFKLTFSLIMFASLSAI